MDESKVILEHLNKNFKYVYDKNAYGKRDAWYVMKHVPFEGDCEDYYHCDYAYHYCEHY